MGFRGKYWLDFLQKTKDQEGSLYFIYISLGRSMERGLWWELDHKKGWCFQFMVLEKTLERPLDSKEIKPVNPKGNQSWKDWCWSWRSNTSATWCKELTHWKSPWCWERLMAGGEGDLRGWDGWMALPTQWTWIWPKSGRLWRTGKPDVLQSTGSQRVGHNLVTEQKQ